MTSSTSIIKSLSLQYYDHGLFASTRRLAAAAVDGVGVATARTLAMLLLRQARAACGDNSECDLLLPMAEPQMARTVTGDDAPAWTGYFDAAKFHARTAICHADLGRLRLSQHHFPTALGLVPTAKSRDLAIYTGVARAPPRRRPLLRGQATGMVTISRLRSLAGRARLVPTSDHLRTSASSRAWSARSGASSG